MVSAGKALATAGLAGLASLCAATALFAQATQPANQSSPAKLLGSADIVRPADYPADARRLKQQGRVWIELEVDERGRVSRCHVEKSSGHEDLDRAACRLYQKRARFRPARDANGKTTTAKDQRSILWRIADSALEASDFDSPDLVEGAGVIRSEDYPFTALDKKEQGTVGAVLRIDALGKVDSCTVEQSSGSAALDTTTCEVLVTRGRFEPARDDTGAAVAGEYRQKVTWRIDDSPDQLSNSSTEVSYRFDAAGKVESCQAHFRVFGEPPRQIPCPPDALTQAPENLAKQLASGRALAVAEHLLIVDEAKIAPLAPLKPNERLISQYRLRLKVDRQGKVTACELVEAVPTVDVCAGAPAALAPVLVDGQPKATATITMVHRNLLRFAEAADAGPTLLNAGSLIGEDDYPAKAIDDDLHGSVTVKLAVNPRGQVEACDVQTSSGSALLDAETCRLAKDRARFEPAVNNAGRAVASDFTQTIVWRLEETRSPLTEWLDRMVITFTADRRIASCKRDFEGALQGQPENCGDEAADWISLATSSTSGSLTVEQRFLPRELTIAELEPPANRALFSRYVLRLVIAADGQVSDCTLVQAIGDQHPVPTLCETAPGPFEPKKDSNRAKASVTGTYVMTVRARPAE